MDDFFLTAYRATDRSACARWLKARSVGRDAAVVESAKAVWRATRFLDAPELRALAERALGTALGGAVAPETPFPSTIWYGGATDTYDGYAFRGTFSDFVEHVLVARSREVAKKKEGWVVTPTSTSDGHRTNASTIAMHALNLDCDALGSWDRLLSILSRIGLAYVAYQSGGWSPEEPKWHIIIPLAAPFDTSSPDKIASWKTAYNSCRVVFGALAGLSGEGFDPTVEAPCVPVFITERRTASAPARRVVHGYGRALDLDALLRALPAVPRETVSVGSDRPRAERAALDDAKLEEIASTLELPMSKIFSGRRDLYLALPGALLDRGVAPDDVRVIIKELSERCPGDPRYSPEEKAAKHAEHVHCAETTISRYESGGTYTRIGTLAEQWPDLALAIDEVLPDTLFDELMARQRARAQAQASSAPVPVPVNLGALKKRLQTWRSKMRKSDKFDDKLRAEIVDAMLRGEDLVPTVNGEIVRDRRDRPINRDLAIDFAMNGVARAFPPGAEFEDALEFLHDSLLVMRQEGEDIEVLVRRAETSFRRHAAKRMQRDEERAEEMKTSGTQILLTLDDDLGDF